MRHTFAKNERLCSQILIDALMQRGNPSFLTFPIIFAWREAPLPPKLHSQVLISVAKKRYKRAVDRNHVKRLLREAYRLNKHVLYDGMKEKQLLLHINYIAPEILSFQAINDAMVKSINKLIKEINKS